MNPYFEKQYIVEIILKNKEYYYIALKVIERSWTGRIDLLFANTFNLEAIKLIVNSILLFEKGFFDCSFYQLRQSLELSTTIIYLSELEEEMRKKELNLWKTQSKFPLYSEMVKFLKKNEEDYHDVYCKLSHYFDNIEFVKKKLNKYVHKQGTNSFYVIRNSPLNQQNNNTFYINEFNNYVKTCIGALGIFRIIIDPLPILLMDENIYNRTPDFMTEPFTEEFINDFIGEDNINNYKMTNIYKTSYNYFIENERMSSQVASLVKHQFIDKLSYNDIIKQKHLLSPKDILALEISIISDKIADIYYCDSFIYYITSTQSKRINKGFDSSTIEYARCKNALNLKFDEVYRSYFKISEFEIVIEHNYILTEIEISNIRRLDTI